MTWEELLEFEARVDKAELELRETKNAAARGEYAVDKVREKVHKWKEEHPGNPDNEEPPTEEPPPEEEPPPDEEPDEEPDEPLPDEEPEEPVDIGPDEPNPDPQRGLLPETWLWQKELYDWLLTLTVEDVTIPTDFPKWDDTDEGFETRFQLWQDLAVNQVSNAVYGQGKLVPLYTSNEWFVLDDGNGHGIEATGTIKVARHANLAGYWYQRHIPHSSGEGNPFYKNVGTANRGLVMTAVDLMLTDHWHDQDSNPWGHGINMSADSRILGGCMLSWTYVYRHCKDVLPPETQAAFEAGLRRQTEKIRAQTVNRNTPNMRTRAVAAMANIYASANDPDLRDAAERTAKKHVFGYEDGELETNHLVPQSLFYPQGYVQEGYSPPTTYAGVSLYHFAEARAIAGWTWLDEPLRRMCSFRAHQLANDPKTVSGSGDPIDYDRIDLLGPSAYSARTGAGWDGLQAGHPCRDAYLAAMYEEGEPFHPWRHPQGTTVMDEMAMFYGLRAAFRDGGSVENAFAKVNTLEAPDWSLDHDHHWPPYMPYHADDNRTLYEKRTDILYPFQTTFTKSFHDEWLMHNNGFQVVIEAEVDSGTYGGYRGGSLQSFWTPETKYVILGRKNKKARDWADMERWTSHHVWGRVEGGNFSSAAQRKRDIVFDGLTVIASGPMDSGRQQAPNPLSVENRFDILPEGIRITHSTEGEALELYAALPIYLGSAKWNAEETTIEYLDGDTFVPLEAATTDRIRLTRFGAHVIIALDQARDLFLAPLWQQSYQGDQKIRTLNIAFTDSIQIEIS